MKQVAVGFLILMSVLVLQMLAGVASVVYYPSPKWWILQRICLTLYVVGYVVVIIKLVHLFKRIKF